MYFTDFLNGALFRSIVIILLFLFVKFADNYQDNTKIYILWFGIIITSIYFITFFVSYFVSVSDKERLLYDSLIYRGYIKNSEENNHENWIFGDQIILSVLYLSIYLGLYKLKTDNEAIDIISFKISLLLIVISISIIAKFFIPPFFIYRSFKSPSFNTIQSYVYSSIVLIVLIASYIYYWFQKNNMSKVVILKNIFMILMIVTTVYLVLSPLVNYFNNVECKYFKKKENCDLKSDECSYKDDVCMELYPSSLCSSYNDESSCNNGNNCYYVTNRDDVSDLTEDKLKGLTKCINSDEKCKGEYKSACSATFEPTNRFKECCYNTIFNDSNCIESEMVSRMNNDQIVDTRKEENKTQAGRVGDYSLKSGEKQIEYEAIKGYCYESNIRKDMEAGIYA